MTEGAAGGGAEDGPALRRLATRVWDAARVPRFWLDNALVAVTYAALGWGVSRVFADFGLFPAPHWPAAAVAVAAALIGGWRLAGGIFVGSVLVNHMLFMPPLLVTLGVSVANVVGPLVGAAFVRQSTGTRVPFDRVEHVGLFIGHAVALQAAVTATGGVLVSWGADLVNAGDVPTTWARWFLADAGGALLLGPPLLLWLCRPGLPGDTTSRIGAAALTIALALLTTIVFFDLIIVTAGLAGLPYVLVPLLIWGTLRFMPREALTWVTMIAVIAALGTLSGHGPFGHQSEFGALASTGLMMGAFSATVLLAGALVRERYLAVTVLSDSHADLAGRVQDRTEALEHELAEHRRTEELLQIMRFAVDRSRIMFFLIDPAGRFRYVNDEAVRLTGYDRETLLKMSVFDLRPGYGRPDWEHQWPRIRDGRAGTYESELRTKSGEAVPIEVTPHYVQIGGHEYDFSLVQDIRRRKQAQDELEHRASHDPLTGVSNRREWFARGRVEVARSSRSGTPVAVLMLDLDDFKRINDRYGHEAGDAVLRRFTEVCGGMLREYDVLGRLGGEEFAVLAPGTERRNALALAERLRNRIADTAVELEGASVYLSVSVGVSGWEPGERSIEPAVRRADENLYDAKRAGRNRVSG